MVTHTSALTSMVVALNAPLTSNPVQDSTEVGTDGKLVLCTSLDGSLLGADVRMDGVSFSAGHRGAALTSIVMISSEIFACGASDGNVSQVFELRISRL